MAAGDIVVFDQFLVDCLEKIHDLENDTIKLGLITNAVTPTAADSDPRWGAGGGTNFDTNEVTPGGNYTAEGETVANPAVTLTGGLAQFDGDDVLIAVHASNPTNARWGIIYNSTPAGNQCIGFLDLGAVIDMTAGKLDTVWAATGIFRLNQA